MPTLANSSAKPGINRTTKEMAAIFATRIRFLRLSPLILAL